MTGALVPHAPLLLPQVTPTAEGLSDIWDALTRVQIPEDAVVIVLSPHAPPGIYAENDGSLADFGIPSVTGRFARADVDLGAGVLDAPLDHGALVPLLILDVQKPVVVVGLEGVSDMSDMSDALRKHGSERELFIICSAHTSVRLTERAPLPYSFDAVRLESRFITDIESDCKAAADLADEMWTVGDSCSRTTLSAFGKLFAGAEGRVLAYGSAFGVGYPVVTAEIDV